MSDLDPEEESKIEMGVNTDEMEAEELKRLVQHNREFKDPDVTNNENILELDINNELESIEKNNVTFPDETNTSNSGNNNNNNEIIEKIKNKKNSVVDNKNNTLITQNKENASAKNTQNLINEMEEKDKIIDLLNFSNTDLQEKIEKANTEYQNIMSKLKQRSAEEDETSLNLKIKEVEKEIYYTNSEIDHNKKSIDNLKNKLEFKINLEKAMNLENILKQEILKNKDIKRELESLSKLNIVQIKALTNYDKDNRITEKIDILKTEIKITKDNLKEYQEKFTKQDKYIKGVHEKISSLENVTKKLLIPKREVRKTFSKEDLKTILEVLNNSKNQIKDNKKLLRNITKQNEDKLNNYLSLNKKIESDYKENDKMNKMLIFKKNELRRLVKSNSIENRIERIDNKNTKKILQQNGDISHLFPNRKTEVMNTDYIDSRGDLPMIKNNNRYNNESDIKPKLFSKNPNRKDLELEIDEQENQEEDLAEFSEEENKDYGNDSNIEETDGLIIENQVENQVENFHIEYA